jgi:predicted Zn-dependent protease
MLRFARSAPTQATAVDDLTVEITALRDGRAASVTTNATDNGSLGACASAAVAAAETAALSGAEGGYPGLPPPGPFRSHDGHDPATARLEPATGAAALDAAFEVAAGHRVEAHGIWTAAEVDRGIASTAGVMAAESVTDAFMKVVAIARGGRSGYAAGVASAAGALDPAALARRAATKATAGGSATIPAGEYPVVLEHHAVGELLQWLGSLGLNGLAWTEGRSALSDRIGRRVAASRVNLSDSPRYPGTLPRAFDAEGIPKAPVPLIQDGVAHGVVHDTRSAALCDAASTGHATAPTGAPEGPAPTNLVLLGGGAEDEAELCRPIDRGVYVTRLWYVNPVRPKEMLVTGVTRDGTFLIEDGEVTRPLDELRMTDSVLGLLARVEELSASPRLTSGGEFYGRRFASGVVCPALRASAMRFTA